MNRTRSLLLASLAASILCSHLAPGDSLAFRPKAGTKVSRAWSIKQEQTLDEMNMSMNGQPFPMDLQMDMDMTTENTIEVSDEIVAAADGKITELRRTFDKLGSASSFAMEMAQMPEGGMEQSTTGASALQGKTVTFKWDAEQGAYETSYHESEGEADLIANLDIDMDLAALVPGKDAAAGDTWEIDVKALKPLLMPGGDVGIRPEDPNAAGGGMMPGMDSMGDLNDLVGDLLEGTATAEYAGMQEIEGGKYGVIKLKINIESSNDMADKLAEMAQEMPEGMGEMKVEHMDMEFALEAEGQVLWDVANGQIRMLTLSGKSKVGIDMGMAVSAQGQNMTIENQMAMSGTMDIKLDVSRN
jgi:hypothetical protein